MTPENADDYFEKAKESLKGAQSEYINARYNNSANRCYYACFQAAIAALISAGITPPSRSEEWGHEFVRRQFVGQLIDRRKLYPSSLRETLERNRGLREVADYGHDDVTAVRASRAIGRTENFVNSTRPVRGGSQ